MSHLTYEQRYTIEKLLSCGKKQSEIARLLSVNASTISRELGRNSDNRNGSYRALLAQRKYESRLIKKPKKVKFTQPLRQKVIALLKDDYSPEQIAGTLKKKENICISHESIYQLIWTDKKQKGDLYTHLRRKGRKYRKRGSNKDSRGTIKGRVGIEQRPKEALERTCFGHLEVDTIVGKNHKGAIITLNDLSSGMLWMKKVPSRDAEIVKNKLADMLDQIRPYIKSITADNGKEFAKHQDIADEYCDFFFANPYSPWERGANENLNGLIRQYIPKSSDILNIDEQYIRNVQEKINNRPRKRFEFENPIFMMQNLLFNSEIAFVN
ncbi:MAG: IS30 family transposase [Crocinitomicaceae bacterium]|nr:IS30 family transposase [Crocinitomicaceae bacterium]